VFLAGLLNTLLVSIIGIFATVIGFRCAGPAIAELAAVAHLRRLCRTGTQPATAVPDPVLVSRRASALPNPRQSISVFGSFLSNRGFVVPKPIDNPGLEAFALAILVAIVASLLLQRYARRQLFESGRLITIWPYVLGLLIGLPLLTALLFGAPVTFEVPELKGFNFSGGSRIIPEFVALTVALSTYTAAFIAEIVRAESSRCIRADGGRLIARAAAWLCVAIDCGAAGDAGHPAAAHQPVSQSHQELVAGGGDRISRPVLGICGNDAEPDRAGNRDHRHHHGRLSADFAGDQRDHELLRMAAWPEHGLMSDIAASSSSFVRRELVLERAAPIKTTGFVGFCARAVQFADQHPAHHCEHPLLWFTVVPR
jgi:ABC-type amino acid transport system permease subunit